jgi:hypothetical protein
VETLEAALYKERAEHMVTKTHQVALEDENRELRQRLHGTRHSRLPLPTTVTGRDAETIDQRLALIDY